MEFKQGSHYHEQFFPLKQPAPETKVVAVTKPRLAVYDHSGYSDPVSTERVATLKRTGEPHVSHIRDGSPKLNAAQLELLTSLQESPVYQNLLNTSVNEFEQMEQLIVDADISVCSQVSTIQRFLQGGPLATSSATNQVDNDQTPVKNNTIFECISPEAITIEADDANDTITSFNDADDWGDISSHYKDYKAQTAVPQIAESDRTKTPAAEPESPSKQEIVLVTPRVESPYMRPDPVIDGEQLCKLNKIVQEKIASLEGEISRFRSENKRLADMTKDLHTRQSTLNEQKRGLEADHTSEVQAFEQYRKDETEKIRKERKVLDQYRDTLYSAASGKTQLEVDSLRVQLADAEARSKEKENRLTQQVARLKDQVRQLQGENATLQQELKLLERMATQSGSTQGKPTQLGNTQGKHTPAVAPKEPVTKVLGTSNKQTKVVPKSVPSGQAVTNTRKLPPATQPNVKAGTERPDSTTPRAATPADMPVPSPAKSESANEIPYLPAKENTSCVNEWLGELGLTLSDGRSEKSRLPDGKQQYTRTDGSRRVVFANGTQKLISTCGENTLTIFFNGDLKKILADDAVVYYYSDTDTKQTTYSDGLEVIEFSNGQKETKYPNGRREVHFPDGTIKQMNSDGSEQSWSPDGVVVTTNAGGQRVLEFPNGQKEIHTDTYKCRVYPDGVVKTVFTNGLIETRYTNGEIRRRQASNGADLTASSS